jgi:hypothetical protein
MEVLMGKLSINNQRVHDLDQHPHFVLLRLLGSEEIERTGSFWLYLAVLHVLHRWTTFST